MIEIQGGYTQVINEGFLMKASTGTIQEINQRITTFWRQELLELADSGKNVLVRVYALHIPIAIWIYFRQNPMQWDRYDLKVEIEKTVKACMIMFGDPLLDYAVKQDHKLAQSIGNVDRQLVYQAAVQYWQSLYQHAHLADKVHTMGLEVLGELLEYQRR